MRELVEGKGARRSRRRSGIPAMLAVALFLVSTPAGAQEMERSGQADQAPQVGPMEGGLLLVRSNPPGAVVTLQGEHRWRGTAPFDLDRGLDGTYRVWAELEGYERWNRTIHLSGSNANQLEIDLSPKRRWKAAGRSLLVPGWGQIYAGEGLKGSLLLLGATGAGIATAWTHDRYQDRVDALDAARDAYLGGNELERLPELRQSYHRAVRQADRAYDDRRIAQTVALGCYAIALIDALAFFPSRSEGGFAVAAPWGESGPALSLLQSGPDRIRVGLAWTGREGGER